MHIGARTKPRSSNTRRQPPHAFASSPPDLANFHISNQHVQTRTMQMRLGSGLGSPRRVSPVRQLHLKTTAGLGWAAYSCRPAPPGRRRYRACSAGLKNTVPADYCEKKIMFWQDVNSDYVRWLASRQPASQPAEHATDPWRLAASRNRGLFSS